MDRIVRCASEQNADVLSDILCRSFRDVAERFGLTPGNCPRHPSNCTPAWIAADFAGGRRYLLLELDGRPAGCVATARHDECTGEIERLAVLPEYRRTGCGSFLLDHALQQLRENGLARARLAITADHADLRGWYLRRGFLPAETRRFDHLPFAVTFLERSL